MSAIRKGKRGRPIVPAREQWRLDRDARYAAELARDPEAAAWLAKFDHEVTYGSRFRRAGQGLHTDGQIRRLDRERKARDRNPDVLTVARGPGIDTRGARAVDAFLARHTGGIDPGAAEDAAIARLDWERAVAVRHGSEDA